MSVMAEILAAKNGVDLPGAVSVTKAKQAQELAQPAA